MVGEVGLLGDKARIGTGDGVGSEEMVVDMARGVGKGTGDSSDRGAMGCVSYCGLFGG